MYLGYTLRIFSSTLKITGMLSCSSNEFRNMNNHICISHRTQETTRHLGTNDLLMASMDIMNLFSNEKC